MGLNQEEFGEQINFSKVYVGYIETGLRPVTKKFKNVIIRSFNLLEEELTFYYMMHKKLNDKQNNMKN